ncbi:addiction module RelB/DinJ family antitoxin [Ereboglobus sp. PH5-5]|uniref:type II toxin-antitoxin system RelB/DinJ family antitoxin n=1 Tax=Ereboglobus sp. PH5-5 TaxID=2940529 RepID=UPI002404FF59|nr:type II toxin-antitoxin system RelB/DinJ family antitoxin [Ereboglobus sp. PH5-5]MDF9834039.1 addiction module RelB/DinJ family antitoxin [Ereboglobus sp. PH5-5]
MVTATQTTQIRIRVPARRMKKVQKLFDEMGTDATGAINMFLAQVERNGRLPFEVVAREMPNAATRAAMREADELAKRPAYASKKDFFAALKSK